MAAKIPPSIEGILKAHQCLEDLEALVKAGCNQAFLLSLLAWLKLASRKRAWKQLAEGMRSPRELRKMAKRLFDCAGELERFNRSFLVWLFTIQFATPYPHEAPALLRRSAEFVEGLLAYHSGNKKRLRNLLEPGARAFLVAYVRGAVRRPHDKEVSALIAAVEDRSYSADAHRVWRESSAGTRLIEAARRQLPIPPPPAL